MTRTAIATLALTAFLAAPGLAQQAPQGPSSTTQPRVGANFVDADGDGICDRNQQQAGKRAAKGKGPANGSGNQGVGPKDGTGFGAMSGAGRGTGAGTCTGACPGGQAARQRGGRR